MSDATNNLAAHRHDSLKTLEYSTIQQCIHCGFCLPTCPTWDETRQERNSPRGRIALMRAIADGRMNATKEFGDEMYFCLGCLACKTACPSGVDYTQLFETARATAEQSGALKSTKRDWVRRLLLKELFRRPRLLRAIGRGLYLFQVTGLQNLFRRLKLSRFRAPKAAPVGLQLDKLTYHEACHLCHGQKITIQPREILKSIPGLKLTELTESTWCCGSAGTYNIVQPEMSQKLITRKLKHIDTTKATVVVTANPGCHLQLSNGAKLQRRTFQVRHPISLLAAAWAERT